MNGFQKHAFDTIIKPEINRSIAKEIIEGLKGSKEEKIEIFEVAIRILKNTFEY